MTRRRMEVSAEEEQILLGLRHERDIWNKALEAAAAHVAENAASHVAQSDIIKLILELRK